MPEKPEIKLGILKEVCESIPTPVGTYPKIDKRTWKETLLALLQVENSFPFVYDLPVVWDTAIEIVDYFFLKRSEVVQNNPPKPRLTLKDVAILIQPYKNLVEEKFYSKLLVDSPEFDPGNDFFVKGSELAVMIEKETGRLYSNQTLHNWAADDFFLEFSTQKYYTEHEFWIWCELARKANSNDKVRGKQTPKKQPIPKIPTKPDNVVHTDDAKFLCSIARADILDPTFILDYFKGRAELPLITPNQWNYRRRKVGISKKWMTWKEVAIAFAHEALIAHCMLDLNKRDEYLGMDYENLLAYLETVSSTKEVSELLMKAITLANHKGLLKNLPTPPINV